MSDSGQLHREDTFGKLPIDLIEDQNISDGACRLYAQMHWRYGSNADDHESQGKKAEALSVCKETIRNRQRELVTNDWIVIIARHGKDGQTSNFYHVFESRKACQAWRESLSETSWADQKTGITSTVLPKPQLETARKGRKGAGNHTNRLPTQLDFPPSTQVESAQDAADQAYENFISDEDGTQPSLTPAINPGWDKTDSSDPDSLSGIDSSLRVLNESSIVTDSPSDTLKRSEGASAHVESSLQTVMPSKDSDETSKTSPGSSEASASQRDVPLTPIAPSPVVKADKVTVSAAAKPKTAKPKKRFKDTWWYFVNESINGVGEIRSKACTKAEMEQYTDHFATCGYLPRQGKELNANPLYANMPMARKQKPKLPVFDVVETDCNLKGLGGRVSSIIGALAESMDADFKDIVKDPQLADRVHRAMLWWSDQKDDKGRPMRTPNHKESFIPIWNRWTKEIEGKKQTPKDPTLAQIATYTVPPPHPGSINGGAK